MGKDDVWVTRVDRQDGSHVETRTTYEKLDGGFDWQPTEHRVNIDVFDSRKFEESKRRERWLKSDKYKRQVENWKLEEIMEENKRNYEMERAREKREEYLKNLLGSGSKGTPWSIRRIEVTPPNFFGSNTYNQQNQSPNRVSTAYPTRDAPIPKVIQIERDFRELEEEFDIKNPKYAGDARVLSLWIYKKWEKGTLPTSSMVPIVLPIPSQTELKDEFERKNPREIGNAKAFSRWMYSKWETWEKWNEREYMNSYCKVQHNTPQIYPISPEARKDEEQRRSRIKEEWQERLDRNQALLTKPTAISIPAGNQTVGNTEKNNGATQTTEPSMADLGGDVAMGAGLMLLIGVPLALFGSALYVKSMIQPGSVDPNTSNALLLTGWGLAGGGIFLGYLSSLALRS